MQSMYLPLLLLYPSSTLLQVLVVDPERKRISLTAKRTLIGSTMPVLSKMDDVKTGIVTHAVVFKVSPAKLMVEFYNNLKAIVPAKEMRYELRPF